MKNSKIAILIIALTLCAYVNTASNLTSAYEFDPGTNFAQFQYAPYPLGPNNMTIYVIHYDTHNSMTIYLSNYSDIVATYSVNKTTQTATFNYNATNDAIWRLSCYVSGWGEYQTDETRDRFNITDPIPNDNNLGSDWARHPSDFDIYRQALLIINYNASITVCDAGKAIYSHVLANFTHADPPNFRVDTILLSEMKTNGNYTGKCWSDAVLLTSYSRALGIPARVIEIAPHWTPLHPPSNWPQDDLHYFAEFYNSPNSTWIPFDGDPVYNWFGLTQANLDISALWPATFYQDGHTYHYSLVYESHPYIVYTINSATSYIWHTYSSHPYRNDL